VSASSSSDSAPGDAPFAGPLAVRDVRVLPSPDATPIDRATVVIDGGQIIAVGPDAPIPKSAQVIPGEGRVVTAGFWNSHVHFTQEKWRRALRKSPSLVEAVFHDMLTSRGFTTVVDTGSDPRVTLTLRGRIEYEGLLGPAIYTAGSSVFPPSGIPYYLHDSLSPWVRALVPTPRTPWAARGIVRRSLNRGADLVKLFTGSYVQKGIVRTMPEPVAKAAVETAHARGKLVFSHPSNLEGTRIAIRSGVDVLAHPPDTTAGVDEAIVREMVDRRMAMIPTLKMFARSVSEDPAYLEPISRVVRQFHELGGQLLFGTDVGYMTDYATEEEFRALADCGLDAREVLRSLTTAPAERFGVANKVGTVTVGARADLTVLDADPEEHPLAFTRVRATIRRGRVLHLRP
jgi:imidazolonepropionase-like amidohydrolase